MGRVEYVAYLEDISLESYEVEYTETLIGPCQCRDQFCIQDVGVSYSMTYTYTLFKHALYHVQVHKALY